MDNSRLNVLLKKFYERLKLRVKWRVEKHFKVPKFDEEPLLDWDEEMSILNVGYFVSDEVLAFMNADPEIGAVVSGALKDVFRYIGPIKFSLDIPF